ncbi:MAG: DUF4234 domain-containing protein [Solirubrobacterales bacterium]
MRHQDPLLTTGLMVITLGIYGLFWYYRINKELVELGRSRNVAGLGDNPTLSLLALLPGGFLFIPPYISYYGCTQRIRTAQTTLLGRATINGVLIVVMIVLGFLLLLPLLFIPYHVQSAMNTLSNGPATGLGSPQP